MITDPFFYLVAVPAVILVGLSKGGFGGALAVLALPLLSLAVPPMTAAGIMLPILMVMDAVALRLWWGQWDRPNVRILLPALTLGTALGWATAAFVTDQMIRLMLGLLGLLFVLDWLRLKFLSGEDRPATGPNWPKGLFWGGIAGFTSFISHVGGPPLQFYLLPQKPTKEAFVATFTLVFAYVNWIKLIPFALLGALSVPNLSTSAVLLPLAAVSTLVGGWLVKRVSTGFFFGFVYVVLALVSIKLIWDAVGTFVK